jgi:hypothetical protein
MLAKILGAASLGGTMVGIGLLHRFLIASAQMMILVIVSSFMLCASLVSVFYIIYFCLVQFGVTSLVAGIILGVLALLTTVVLVVLTQDQFNRLRWFHYRYMRGLENNGSDIGHVAMAFIDGFFNKKS